MAAPQSNQTTRREEIEFPPNVPVTLSLKYSEPRMIAGRNGERAMLTTTDNRICFLDPAIAGRITELGINVREEFSITRKSSGKRGDKDEWIVERTSVGERPDGTFAVSKLPDEPHAKPPQRASWATGSSLADAVIGYVDDYAKVLDYALRTYEGRVKPDEVRAIFLTVAINRSRVA